MQDGICRMTGPTTTIEIGPNLVKIRKRGGSFGSEQTVKEKALEWTKSKNSRNPSLTILTISSTSQTPTTTQTAMILGVQIIRLS